MGDKKPSPPSSPASTASFWERLRGRSPVRDIFGARTPNSSGKRSASRTPDSSGSRSVAEDAGEGPHLPSTPSTERAPLFSSFAAPGSCRVHTPGGLRRLKDLAPREKVWGDGQWCEATARPLGRRVFYRVRLSNGVAVSRGIDHLWRVQEGQARSLVPTRELQPDDLLVGAECPSAAHLEGSHDSQARQTGFDFGNKRHEKLPDVAYHYDLTSLRAFFDGWREANDGLIAGRRRALLDAMPLLQRLGEPSSFLVSCGDCYVLRGGANCNARVVLVERCRRAITAWTLSLTRGSCVVADGLLAPGAAARSIEAVASFV
jgi:hypothetical protein